MYYLKIWVLSFNISNKMGVADNVLYEDIVEVIQ